MPAVTVSREAAIQPPSGVGAPAERSLADMIADHCVAENERCRHRAGWMMEHLDQYLKECYDVDTSIVPRASRYWAARAEMLGGEVGAWLGPGCYRPVPLGKAAADRELVELQYLNAMKEWLADRSNWDANGKVRITASMPAAMRGGPPCRWRLY